MPSIEQSKVFQALIPKRSDPTGRPIIRCTCTLCGEVGEITGNQYWPTEALAKNFAKIGWQIDAKGKKAKCAACLTPVREEQPVKAAAPSKPAALATVHAYKAIEQGFLVDDGRYVSGTSDKTIAMEFGLSAEVVASIRKENFGELKTDPGVAKIQADLATFATNLDKEIKELRQMVDMMASEHAKEVAGFRLRVEQAVKALGQ